MGQLTLQQVADFAKHATGAGDNTTLGTPVDEVAIARQALEYLYASHKWEWRRKGPVDVDMYAETFEVRLPFDFDTADFLTFPGFFYAEISPTSIYNVMQLRANTPTVVTSGLWFAYAYNNGAEEVPLRTRGGTDTTGALSLHTGGTISSATPTTLSITMDAEYSFVRGDTCQLGGANITARRYIITAFDSVAGTVTLNESPLTVATTDGTSVTLKVEEEDFTSEAADATQNQRLRDLIEVYPKLSTTRLPGLEITYFRKANAQTLATTQPALIPDWLDWGWVQLARMFAQAVEDDNALSAAKMHWQADLLPEYLENDGVNQPNLGVMQGGLYPRSYNTLTHEPSIVSDP